MSCQAWVPAEGIPGAIVVLRCRAPIAAVYLYRCAHGHQRTGETCADHDPVPDAVGCFRCLQELGHDCPMTFELIKIIRRTSLRPPR